MKTPLISRTIITVLFFFVFRAKGNCNAIQVGNSQLLHHSRFKIGAVTV